MTGALLREERVTVWVAGEAKALVGIRQVTVRGAKREGNVEKRGRRQPWGQASQKVRRFLLLALVSQIKPSHLVEIVGHCEVERGVPLVEIDEVIERHADGLVVFLRAVGELRSERVAAEFEAGFDITRAPDVVDLHGRHF